MSGFLGDFRWLGYQGLLINKKPRIYINPYQLAFPDVGDIILVTDNTVEHCSPDDIKWLRKGATVIVALLGAAERFQGDIRTAKPGEEFSFNGVIIKVYQVIENDVQNLDIIAFGIEYKDGLKILYTPSNTLKIDENQKLTDCLFFPIRVEENWTFSESCQLVNKVEPKIAIPLNWDGKKESIAVIDQNKGLFSSKIELLKPKP